MVDALDPVQWTREKIEETEAAADEERQRRLAHENEIVQIRVYLMLPAMVKLWRTKKPHLVMSALISYLTGGTVVKCPDSILDRVTRTIQSLPDGNREFGFLQVTEARKLSFTLAIRRVDAENIKRRLPMSVYSDLVRKTRITALRNGS